MYKLEYDNKIIKKRESKTDTSKWLPNVNVLNTSDVINTSNPKPALFPDGKDNGMRLYDVTNAKDITLRMTAMERLKADCRALEKTATEVLENELINIGSSRNPKEPSEPQNN